MNIQEKIGKVTKIFEREDGSQVRIVAENCALPGNPKQIGYYVHKRKSAGSNWELCNDRPHKDWKKMSVEDYINHGRSEVFQVLTHSEILGVTSMIGRPMPKEF